jgi:succinate-acetate transporter protein
MSSQTVTEKGPAQSDTRGATPRDDAPTAAVEAPSNPFFAGAPGAVGVPIFVAGSVALGLVLVGYVPPAAVGASIPIIGAATGVGLVISTIWAAALGQSVVASIFGLFAGFWLSYATLVLGLTHNWFGIPLGGVVHTIGLFLITWLVVLGLLTLATLRLPLAFTVLFVLIDATLAVVLAATVSTSIHTASDLTKLGGWGCFAFAAVGAYIFLATGAQITGGKGWPLGPPILK